MTFVLNVWLREVFQLPSQRIF